jgi:predicted metalloprotease
LQVRIMDWEKGEESENLEDRRGVSPKTMAVGGLGTVVLLLVGYVLGVNPQVLNQLIGNAPRGGGAQQAPTADMERSREFASKILRFTEKVWDHQFRQAGKEYTPPHMVLFDDNVQTGCGDAPSAVGPFYCPADKTVYLDPTFFAELEQNLGGSQADFSKAYVIAHEVGHHVQNLLGYSRIVEEKRRSLPKSESNQWSVRLELQADYLAGVWAHDGQEEFQFIQPGDVESAIQSANAIGDDRLQKRSRGFSSPENYTHGTSAQRVKYFKLGLETGNLHALKKFFETPYEEL